MTQPVLELRGLTKAFGDNVANDAISMEILPGRVHAIVGENGAGKTTMMSMIAGLLQPDDGEIFVDGEVREINSPHDASSLGIGMVHQHFKLVPSLSVTDNIFLGREIRSSTGLVDKEAMRTQVRELSESFGLHIDPDAAIRQLSVGLRQRVEVIKALSHDTRILILDEPTAVLTPSESEELFNVMRRLADSGCAVVFISHKLKEVLAVADDVTVIRDGKHVVSQPAAGLTPADIAKLMVGREVLLRIQHTVGEPGETALKVEDISYVDERGALVLDNLSLDVREGEIVGIAGVEGNGQTELASAIAGLLQADTGRITIGDKDITDLDTSHRRAAGLAYVPEDRHHTGTAPSMSITDNIVATHQDSPIVTRGWIHGNEARDHVSSLIDTFDIRGAGPRTPVGRLSGGNMQKVVIAREFSSSPKVLIASQPTRGVDVGAMEFVHNSIVSARDAGAAVLLISADLNEVMSLSDRLLVVYRGRVVAEFTQETMSESAVGLAMAGHVPTPAEIAEGRAAQAAGAGDDATVALVDADEAPGADVFDEVAHLEIEHEGEGFAAAIKRLGKAFLRGSVQPVLAVGIALLIGAIVVLAMGESPIAAYNELFFSAFRRSFTIGTLVSTFIPLVILAVAVIVSFKAGFFNIGGEGQLVIGALSAAIVGVALPDLPTPLLLVLIMIGGMIGGALWGLIPGVLLAYWRVDIIVTTLMMSSIAGFFTAYMVTAGPMRDPSAGFAASLPIPADARLPMFFRSYRIGLDLVIALIVVVVLGLVLTKTVWGLKVRELGEMNNFAAYTGVSTKKMSIQVMSLGGAMAGLAGALFVIGPLGGRFLQDFSPGYGFLGITVALLARLNPWAGILAAFFYANMMVGSNAMQINTQVPYSLVNVLQGIIILLITASILLTPSSRKKLGRLFKNRRGAVPVKGA